METIPGRQRLIVLLGVVGFLGMTACASRDAEESLPVTLPGSFSAAGPAGVPERWWQAFEDDRLDALVDRALDGNLDLAAAWQRLQAARAVVDRESGAFYPDLQGSAEAATTGGTPVDTRDEALLVLASSYELDLWGRVRAAVAAERYRARATLEDYHTASLSLAAAVTGTWYRLAEARSQLTLVEAQIDTNEQLLELLERRFATGLVRAVDILRQRQLVEATRQQAQLVRSRLGVLEHQLAVLLGRPPQRNLIAPPGALPELGPLPDTGVPVALLDRRPDVRSARARLAAADRDLSVAISNRFPRLTLSASASSAGDDADALFEDWAYALAAGLAAPIFTGGSLAAEVDRNEAVTRQRLYEYGQTVLTAFREVEDALVLEATQRRAIANLERQVSLATQAYEQLRFQYFNGDANYLDVLTALDEVQQLRRDRLAAALDLVEFRIALYRALAGPVDVPPT